MISAVVYGTMEHGINAAGSTGWIGYVASVLVLLGFIFGAPCLWAWAIRGWQPGDDSDDGGNGGGGWPRRPTPPTRPTDSDPPWWPEFERDFAAYVDRRPTYAR